MTGTTGTTGHATPTGGVHFDPTDPEVRADPYPTYHRMREEAPAWRSPEGIWYFTRYDDCYAMLRSPTTSYDRTTTDAFRASLSDDPDERAEQIAASQRQKSLLDTDPPDHTRLRSLINRAFTAPSVEASRPTIEAFTDGLLDDIDGPEAELVGEFAVLLPMLVICDMLGLPIERRARFIELGDAIARSVDPDVTIEFRLAAVANRNEFLRTLIDERRASPGDDLVTRWIRAADDGLADDDELVTNTGALLTAGFETTTNLITNSVHQLLEHPDQLAALVADPSLVRTAVEEVLRFDPPVHMGRPRTFTEKVTYRGVELRPGDSAVTVVAAANRDPEEFPDPDRFDIRRQPNRHLTFGMGPHLCVGAALARMEAQTAVLRLFDRFPALARAGAPTMRPNLSLRGFATYPVAPRGAVPSTATRTT